MSLTLEIGNTSLAVVRGVKNAFATEYDDGATLSFTLMETDGTPVPPQAWPASMYNEPGGTYACTIDSDVDVKLNHTYIGQVDGVGSGGEIMLIREQIKAVSRGDAC